MNKIKNTVTTTTLRSYGYLTADEFVDALVPGLKAYLKENGSVGKELSHPEDLAYGAVSYIETLCHVFATFGVNYNTVKKN